MLKLLHQSNKCMPYEVFQITNFNIVKRIFILALALYLQNASAIDYIVNVYSMILTFLTHVDRTGMF